MGTAWIFWVLVLTGAIVQSSPAAKQQIPKTTTTTTSSSKRFNTTKPFKKNTWTPVTSDTPAPFHYHPTKSTILQNSNVGSHRHVSRSVHDRQYRITPLTASPMNWPKFPGNSPEHDPLTAGKVTSDTSQFPDNFFKIGSNFRVTNHQSNSKQIDSNPQSSVINTGNLEYPRVPLHNQQSAESSGLTQNIVPTFSASLENNFGKFEPFPPFKYSGSHFQFPGVHQALPSDPIVSSLEYTGRSNPKNFGGANSPFLYGNHHRGQVLPAQFSVRPKFQQFTGVGVSGFNGNGIGRPNEGYQPLSGQPQLHFGPIGYSQPFGKIRDAGEVLNQIDVNQSGGRGSGEGAIKNFYPPGNSGNTYPVTSFANGDSFEVPGSSAFNDYDKTFGKYATGAHVPPPRGNVIKQYHHAPVTEGNEEEKDGNDEKSEYRSEEEERDSREQNNDEDESENQYNERRGGDGKREDQDGRKGYKKNYGDELEREFEDSYNKEHPPEEFEHSEEVLELEEAEKNHKKLPPKTRNHPRNPSSGDRKRQDYEKTSHPVHEPEEVCAKNSYSVREDDSPESRNYRRNEPSAKTSPYGHKITRRRPSRFATRESNGGRSPSKHSIRKNTDNHNNSSP